VAASFRLSDDGAVPLTPTTISITLVPPDADDARKVLREYWSHIVSRYYSREATGSEIDSAMADEPSGDLTHPHGLFWVATNGAAVVGCVGLRLLPDGVGEVTRVFVGDTARRQGIGSRLLTVLEDVARARGLSTLRLDTRHDLVEARQLYAKQGYAEVPAFNNSPYAGHWFAKSLTN
jgi:ribosomal protein S18 acetylase RimI-like enzyme